MISIIIPVYNAEKTIGRCIKSILSQRNVDIEIICVNDMSTDSTLKEIQEIAKSNPSIKIIDIKEKLGLSHVRNEGLKAIHGDFFTFADADDELTSDYFFLSKAEGILRNENADLLIYGYDLVYPSSKKHVVPVPQGKKMNEVNKKDLISSISVYTPYNVMGYTWNKIWRKNESTTNKYFIKGLQSYEDMLWCLGMIKGIGKAILFNEIGYNYFVNPSSMTRSKTPLYGVNRDAHSVLALSLVNYFLIENGIKEQAKTLSKRIRLAAWDCFRHAIRSRDIRIIKYRFAFLIETILNISKNTESKTVKIIIRNGNSISLPQASILSILSCAWCDFQIYIETSQETMKKIEKQLDETFFFTSKIAVTNETMRISNPDLVISNETILPKNALKRIQRGEKSKYFNLNESYKRIDYPQI